MVVLRLGGVYADVDTECKLPLNEIILPKDTLIVSWENEFSTAEEARQRKYVRKRQVTPPPPHPPTHTKAEMQKRAESQSCSKIRLWGVPAVRDCVSSTKLEDIWKAPHHLSYS